MAARLVVASINKTTANGNNAVDRPERGNKKGKFNMDTIELTRKQSLTLYQLVSFFIMDTKKAIERYESLSVDDEFYKRLVVETQTELADLRTLLEVLLKGMPV